MTTHLTRALLTIVLLAVATPATATAESVPLLFHTPGTLSPTGFVARSPNLSMAPDGGVTTAWSQARPGAGHGQLAVARGKVGGRLGRTIDVIGRSGPGAPHVAATSTQSAVAWDVWDQGAHKRYLRVRVAQDGQPFSRRQTLSDDGLTTPEIGWEVRLLAAGDRFVALWCDPIPTSTTIFYAITDRRGTFGPARALATGVSGSVSAAAAPGGTVTAVWSREGEPPVMAQLSAGARRFGARRPATAATAIAGPGGTAVSGRTADGALRAQRLAAPAPSELSNPGEGAGWLIVSMPTKRETSFGAWTATDAKSGARAVFAAPWKTDGTFGAPQQLSKPNTHTSGLRLVGMYSTAIAFWTTGPEKHVALHYATAAPLETPGFARQRTLAKGLRTDEFAVSGSSRYTVAAWAKDGRVRWTSTPNG